MVGSFPAGPRMARGVVLLFGALLFKFVGLVLAYGVPIPTGVMLPSIMVNLLSYFCIVLPWVFKSQSQSEPRLATLGLNIITFKFQFMVDVGGL